MAKKLHYSILAISLSFNCLGQWHLSNTIELPKTLAVFATDSQHNLYVGFQDGSLVKYDASGKEVLNFALSNQSPITLVDPQFQLKTFLFYFDNQLITILDRFKGVPKNYPINEFTNGIVSMACPAPDGSFWMVENNPVLLKKINPNSKQVILETQPDLGSEIRCMRTHQNILLVLSESHLHIFDQFGGLLTRFEVVSHHFSIDEDVVRLVNGNKIMDIDPFKGRIIEEVESLVEDPTFYALLDSRQIYVKGNQLFLYERED